MTARRATPAGPTPRDVRPRPTRGLARPDDAAWDAFVERGNPGSYLQLSGWAAGEGRQRLGRGPDLAGATRAAPTDPGRPIGAQILLRRPRPLPWAFAYAPRGPVTAGLDGREPSAPSRRRARRALRARPDRSSHLRIDPEIERDGAARRDGATAPALRAAGWRPADPIQPNATRIIDLAAGRGRALGRSPQEVAAVREQGPDRGHHRERRRRRRALPEFYRIYRETADRAGFLIRTEQAYRDVWEAFAPAGHARLLFARRRTARPLATLFLVRCGTRVVEPYGGMTADGGECRANYLLKWEAIRIVARAGRDELRPVGPRDRRDRPLQDRLRRPRGPLHRGVGPRPRPARPAGLRARPRQARVWWARRRHGLADGAAARARYTGGDAA